MSGSTTSSPLWFVSPCLCPAYWKRGRCQNTSREETLDTASPWSRWLHCWRAGFSASLTDCSTISWCEKNFTLFHTKTMMYCRVHCFHRLFRSLEEVPKDNEEKLRILRDVIMFFKRYLEDLDGEEAKTSLVTLMFKWVSSLLSNISKRFYLSAPVVFYLSDSISHFTFLVHISDTRQKTTSGRTTKKRWMPESSTLEERRPLRTTLLSLR